MTALELEAPAKVNLLLRIRGRREDGYHEVDTTLHALTLHDTLIAERQDGAGSIQLVLAQSAVVSGMPVVAGEDNLVCRAARGFLAAAALRGGARFHLTKRIPAGGGLGGGSSDAAATLRLMNALFGEPVGKNALHRIAASLGADVPFFLRGGTQFATGVGDELKPVEGAPHLHFVLILPRSGTSTAAIYKNHGAHLTIGPPEASIVGDKVPVPKEIAVPTGFPNDLEAAALRLHPELLDIRDRVVALGHDSVRMSGSGSTFFLAFEQEAECRAAMENLSSLRKQGVGLLRTESNHRQHGNPRESEFPRQ